MNTSPATAKSLRLVLVSDTHLRHPTLPEGELLVHAGDFTPRGTRAELERAVEWLKAQPHPHKVAIAGNHDFCLEREPQLRSLFEPEIHYLLDEERAIAGLRIFGSPWTPWFHDWAFNLHRGEPLRKVWERMPAGLDVLLTHGPPLGILDRIYDGRHVGCEDLLHAVQARPPRLHVFGHIHEAYGEVSVDGTRFVNASICDLAYRPVHSPVVVELEVPPAAAPAEAPLS